MKHIKIYSVLVAFFLASFFIYSACTKAKDVCADINCQHGGSCSAGSCICPTGYTGSLCETKILLCVTNNTAQVQFSNRSANSTYSVVWDGSIITTLSPGVTSEYFTEASGEHTLAFQYSNSSANSCTPSTPILVQCSSMVYWCSN